MYNCHVGFCNDFEHNLQSFLHDSLPWIFMTIYIYIYHIIYITYTYLLSLPCCEKSVRITNGRPACVGRRSTDCTMLPKSREPRNIYYIYLSIYPSIHPSIHLSIYIYIYIYLYLYVDVFPLFLTYMSLRVDPGQGGWQKFAGLRSVPI